MGYWVWGSGLQEKSYSVSPVFAPGEKKETIQYCVAEYFWVISSTRSPEPDHMNTWTYFILFFSVDRSVGFIQSVNAMLWDDTLIRFSLMVQSPLLLPLNLSGNFIVSLQLRAWRSRGGPRGTGLSCDRPLLCKQWLALPWLSGPEAMIGCHCINIPSLTFLRASIYKCKVKIWRTWQTQSPYS